jgi:hypothetical protein
MDAWLWLGLGAAIVIGFAGYLNSLAVGSNLPRPEEEPEPRDSYDPQWRHEAREVIEERRERVQRGLEAGLGTITVNAEMPLPSWMWGERKLRYDEATDEAVHPGIWHIRLSGATHETRVGNVVRKSIYKELKPGEMLELRREPENEYDFNCVSVWYQPDVGPALDVGYLPKAWSGHFAALMDRRAKLSAVVHEVVRQGSHGELLFLVAEVRLEGEPELKRRPKRETISRKLKGRTG